MRENELNRNEIFNCVDIEWMPLNENLDDTLNDSLNSSRISLDVSVVKDVVLNKNPSNNGFQAIRNIFNMYSNKFQEI